MDKNSIKSLTQLARISGIPTTTLFNLFNRKSDIKASIIEKMKVSLNTSFEYLISGNGEMIIINIGKTPYIQQLFNALSSNGQATAIGILEVLLSKEQSDSKIIKIF